MYGWEGNNQANKIYLFSSPCVIDITVFSWQLNSVRKRLNTLKVEHMLYDYEKADIGSFFFFFSPVTYISLREFQHGSVFDFVQQKRPHCATSTLYEWSKTQLPPEKVTNISSVTGFSSLTFSKFKFF